MKVALYTITALFAFAANSLLCRMALTEAHSDPWSFTIIRMLSAAVLLGIIVVIQYIVANNSVSTSQAFLKDTGSWWSSICLMVYAFAFSIAYIDLDTGTGALILFTAVQLTMIGWGIYQKERLSRLQWIALFIAIIGFISLMLPSSTVPSLTSASIMFLSGVAWGIYTIRGRSSLSALQGTAFNFIRSLLIIPALLLVRLTRVSDLANSTATGIFLACMAGAITSGLGYSIWYSVLPSLKSAHASVVQLCVPILAAVMGVVFLFETVTMSFLIASSIILGAVLVFTVSKPV